MSALGHLLLDTVYESHATGWDEFGNATWSAPAPVKCRLEQKVERVVDATGTEVTSQAQFVADVTIDPQARIWLPGKDTADPNQAVIPKSVGAVRTLDGRDELWQVWL